VVTKTVAVVDDDPLCREAVTLALGDRWRTVAFSTAKSALDAAKKGKLPPIALMDMSMPGESAGRAIAEIRRARPETQIVALSSHQSDDFVFEALRAGAVGYVLKQHAMEELADVLDMVERGGSPLSPGIARRVLATFHDEARSFEPLSERERQILTCFAAGKSYGECADELGMAIDTVRTHVRRMYKKLQVTGRSQAVLAALRRGLLR
jgi:DNA-binding NarL/FixJ family response regulator